MLVQLLRLSKHSLVYSLGAMAERGVGFLLVPLYTRCLTPEDYGILAMLAAVLAPLMVISSLGVENGLAVAYYDSDAKAERKKAIGTALAAVATGAAVLSGLVLLLAGQLSQALFGTAEYTIHLRLVAVTSLFETLLLIVLTTLRVQEKSKWYVAIVFGKFLLGVTLNVTFIAVLGWGVKGLVLSMVITSAATLIPVLAAVMRNTGLALGWNQLRTMLRFGLPIVPAGIMSQAMGLSDRYMLQFMAGPAELGLYSLGYRFGAVAGVVLVTPFALAWGPVFWAVAKEPNALEFYARAATYYFLAIIFATTVLALLAKEAVEIVATPEFHRAYRAVGLIAGAYVFMGLVTVFASGLMLARKAKWIPLVVGVATAINLALNYIMIQKWGMEGAALATLLSCAVTPLGMWLLSRRYYPIGFEWQRMGKIAAVAGLVLTAGWFIETGAGAIADALLKGMLLLAFPAGLYAAGFLRDDEKRKIREWARR